MKKFTVALFTLVLGLVSLNAAATEIYRGVDQYGNVIFSDKPIGQIKQQQHYSIPDEPARPAINPKTKPRNSLMPQVRQAYNLYGITSGKLRLAKHCLSLAKQQNTIVTCPPYNIPQLQSDMLNARQHLNQLLDKLDSIQLNSQQPL